MPDTAQTFPMSEEQIEALVARACERTRAEPFLRGVTKERRAKVSLGSWPAWASILLLIIGSVGGFWLNSQIRWTALSGRVDGMESRLTVMESDQKTAANNKPDVQGLSAQVSSLQQSVNQLHDDVRHLQDQLMQKGH